MLVWVIIGSGVVLFFSMLKRWLLSVGVGCCRLMNCFVLFYCFLFCLRLMG